MRQNSSSGFNFIESKVIEFIPGIIYRQYLISLCLSSDKTLQIVPAAQIRLHVTVWPMPPRFVKAVCTNNPLNYLFLFCPQPWPIYILGAACARICCWPFLTTLTASHSVSVLMIYVCCLCCLSVSVFVLVIYACCLCCLCLCLCLSSLLITYASLSPLQTETTQRKQASPPLRQRACEKQGQKEINRKDSN